MTSAASIVALTAQHWPAVRAIYAEGIATANATFESEPGDWDHFDAAKLPAHRLVATSADGPVLAWAAVSAVSARPAYAGVVEHSVYVAAAARGRGVGRLVLDALVASTENAGIWTVQAGIFPENTASRRLHRAAGFREVGVRTRVGRAVAGTRAGQWRDVVLVERRSPLVGAPSRVSG